MNTRTTVNDVLRTDQKEREPQRARSRFGAIVRALDALAAGRRPLIAGAPAEFEDALPTRRLNRTRRLLGALPRPGKSRHHTRRLR